MSIEKAKEFLLALNDKDAHDAWKAKMAGTKNDEEALAAAVDLARDMGFDVTSEDITAAMNELKAGQREKTQHAVEDLVALDDDSLEETAGGDIVWSDFGNGFGTGCKYNFTDDDCWWEDACEKLNVRYFGCEKSYYGSDCILREYAGECILGHVKGA